MTSLPRVSVIVPAWNAAATLERALGSVLDGVDIPVECIVVDDGSTDGTAALAERLARADPRIVILRSAANEGVSVARNRALDAAGGEWLCFLDADDRLLPGGLAIMERATRADGVWAVIGQRIWTDGRRRWRSVAYNIPDIRTPGRRSLVTHPGLMRYASATGKLFSRSITEGLRFEGRVLGDQPWTIRALIRAGDGIEVVEADVYEWSRPPRGQVSTSITASKRASARLAAEATRVAIGAMAQVAAEADASIAAPSARATVVGAYFGRLVQSDLAGPVLRAVTRNDEGTDDLFTAIDEFLGSVPPDLEGSDLVAESILRPPLERWLGFRDPGRAAYLRLLIRLLSAYPDLTDRVSRFGLTRVALAVLRQRGSATPLFGGLLALNLPFALWYRLLERARFGVLAIRARWS